MNEGICHLSFLTLFSQTLYLDMRLTFSVFYVSLQWLRGYSGMNDGCCKIMDQVELYHFYKLFTKWRKSAKEKKKKDEDKEEEKKMEKEE